MHYTPLLALLATAAGLAAAYNDPTTNATKAIVQFPGSMMSNQWTAPRNKLNGYIHVAREKCLQLCGHENGVGNSTHHQLFVTPLRMNNTAETICWCCVKDPKGNCYNTANPYTKTDPYGPWVDMTNQLVAKLAMPSIGCTTVTAAQVSAVKPPPVLVKTLVPTPGKTISMNWAGPPSEVGGSFSAFFIDEKKNVVVKSLTNDACTFPNMSGKIALTISGNKDPKASSLYIVARTTLNVAPAARRVKRGLKRVHKTSA